MGLGGLIFNASESSTINYKGVKSKASLRKQLTKQWSRLIIFSIGWERILFHRLYLLSKSKYIVNMYLTV